MNLFTRLLGIALLTVGIMAGGAAQPLEGNKPPSELKQIEFLAGNWTSELEVSMGPGNSTKAKATASAMWTLQGHMMRYNFVSEMPGMGTIFGLLLIGYDADSKNFKTWWFDSLAPGMGWESEGKFEGKLLVVTSAPKDYMGIKDVQVRTTFEAKSEDEVLFTSETRMNGAWVKSMEGSFKREKQPAIIKHILPPPSEEMKKIDFLTHYVKGKEKMLSDGKVAMEIDLRIKNEWGLSNSMIESYYMMDLESMGRFEGLMLTAYNPADKKYHNWYFSSMHPKPMIAEGVYENAQLVLISQPFESPAGKLVLRMTFLNSKTEKRNYWMDVQTEKGWDKLFEGFYETP
ncbi:MAG: DUF1579 family protein [Fimbriimonadia bacterium]|nr:DUF1579 family protein [Fimbriimonadia bacterium]